MTGGSPEMAKIAEYIKRAANTDACVLITGESGVGKEEVANAEFRRNDRPYPVGMTEAVSWQ